MSVILGMLAKKEVPLLAKVAEEAESLFLKAGASLGAAHLEKRAMMIGSCSPLSKMGMMDGDILSPANPVVSAIRERMRDHPPEGMEQLRDMYVQVTQRALQKELTKLETSDDVDPMGVALKNLRRMASMLRMRLEIAKSQRELQEFQKDLAGQQGVGATPAGAATAQLPLAAAPPPLPPAPMPGPPPGMGPGGPGPGMPPPGLPPGPGGAPGGPGLPPPPPG